MVSLHCALCRVTLLLLCPASIIELNYLNLFACVQGHSRAREIPQFGPHVLQVRMPLKSLYMDTLVQLGCHVAFVYRGAAAAVIVFDITSKDSFAKAKSWIKELQRQVITHSWVPSACRRKPPESSL